jgi:hypothetical protein
MAVHVYVLTGRRKKCIEGATTGDITAIAHDDDLRFIEDMVCSSQNTGIYTQIQPVMHLPRKR